jgi:transposase
VHPAPIFDMIEVRATINQRKGAGVQLKTILNRIQKYKGFVYKSISWNEDAADPTIDVEVEARSNSWAVCSGCGKKASGYDTRPARRFEFIPLWGIRVFLVYASRRVNCQCCGVLVEKLPWAVGKHQLTQTYAWHLSGWAKRLSWKETAEAFSTSWYHVFHSVEMAVNWGLANRDLSGIEAIGVDEIQWRRGHKYLTLVYQIDSDCKRLLWIGEERKEATLNRFFDWFGIERSGNLQFVCSDMWRPYLNVIADKAAQAIHVLDRFHIMAHLNKAIDEVRAGEARQMKADGFEPLLTNSRWVLLKRPENLTDKQDLKLAQLLDYNLKSIRSYLLKEDFQQLWHYRSPVWAGKFLDQWCTRTMRSKIDPMKKAAKRIRKHRELILNWFRAGGQYSSGIVEGFNNKAKLTMRKAYGFKSFRTIEIALYHTIGGLPEPKTTHRFF